MDDACEFLDFGRRVEAPKKFVWGGVRKDVLGRALLDRFVGAGHGVRDSA
jgi:hypothetical protein